MTDIKFLGMAPSITVELAVNEWLAKIERLHPRITKCSVVIEQPHHHHRRGNCFDVRVELAIPDHVFVATNAHEDPYLAIATSFLAVRRQVREFLRQRQSRTAA